MVDGCIDLWGIPANWTALAPDFQALPRNVVYMEKEDEFDVVEGDKGKGEEEEEDVDVTTVERITMFESDSEEESEAFMLKLDSDAVVKFLLENRAGEEEEEGEEELEELSRRK